MSDHRGKVLIWLDILGFENLARKIAAEIHITSRKVRTDFITVIGRRIDATEAKNWIVGKSYGKRDDWLLVTESLDLAFRVISEILDHNTDYEGYEKIPLEIGIGIGEYDRWARFDGSELIVEDSTISFLKTNMIGYFHSWYRNKHNGKSPTSTFVVITQSAYNELETLDRKKCQEIGYKKKVEKGKTKIITFFITDVSNIRQRGRLFSFLEKIKHPRSKLYDRIDEVFVPPLEYKEIKKTLDKRRIIFITGTAEYGKTYTAVRLLWEYYNRGYKPIWIQGAEFSQRMAARERLEEIERELKSLLRAVIYFEDPFGKLRYERREILEREIGTIISCVREFGDVYLIITSREEVFKEFEERSLSSVKLGGFQEKLSIKKPSYDYEKRKEILLGWADSKGCKWLRFNRLKETTLQYLKDSRKLPTPLSIRDFVISTVSISGEEDLVAQIKDKSKETARSFADEIVNMTEDRKLFLSFPFISPFPKDFVREEYEKMTEKMNLTNAAKFDKMLEWFKDDKIETGELEYRPHYYAGLRFSHPSYLEALDHLLVKKGQFTHFNTDIFSKVILELANQPIASEGVAQTIVGKFEKLPQQIRKLLLEMSEKDETAGGVAIGIGLAIAYGHCRLPETMRNELLIKLSQKATAAEDIVCTIAAILAKLPKEFGELLVKLSEKDEIAGGVSWAIGINFDELPKRIRNKILLNLSRKDAVKKDVARIIKKKSLKFPEKN